MSYSYMDWAEEILKKHSVKWKKKNAAFFIYNDDDI